MPFDQGDAIMPHSFQGITRRVPHWSDTDALAAYRAYIEALSPTLWLRFDEASGDIVNYGSDGNTGTVSSATQGQTGQLGENEAYLWDGIDDYVMFANADIASTRALTAQRWMFLVNAASLGELSSGRFISYQGATALIRFLSTNRFDVFIDLDTTDARATTNDNQVDFLGDWALIFADYDDANDLGLGRKIRIMRATAASATTLLTLATDTAGVGTIVEQPFNLYVGNNNTASVTLDGVLDELVGGAGLWSPAGSPADLSVPDAIRSLVFGV